MDIVAPHHTVNVRGLADWTPVVAQSLLDFSMQCANPTEFLGSIKVTNYAGIHLVDMTATAHSATRRQAKMMASPGQFVIPLQVFGSAEIRQERRTVVLEPGDFTVYDTTHSFFTESTSSFRCINFRVDAAVLGIPVDQLRSLTATRIRGEIGIAPAVAALLTNLNETLDTAVATQPRAAAEAAHLTVKLMRSMLVGVLESRDDAPRDDSISTISEILLYVEENLHDASLSAENVARSVHLSKRQLQRYFQAMGTSFNKLVRIKRIEQCKIDLADPRRLEDPVALVGATWGFDNPSHFAQIFRAVVGVSPSAFRRRAVPENLSTYQASPTSSSFRRISRHI